MSRPPPRPPRAPAALALLAALALPGCLLVGGHGSIGPRLSEQAVAALEPGVTTKDEVLARFGPPNEYRRPELTSALIDDELRLSGALRGARQAERVFTYQRDDVELRGTFLLLFAFADVTTRSERLVVWFDERDVVREVAFGEAAP